MWDEEAISIPAIEPDLPKWIWCLVATVREYPSDALYRDVKTERRGTKHFAPGTRVYVYPVQWGDGWDWMVVVGKKRGTHRYVRKVMWGASLDNFRLKKVYSPTIISWMCGKRSEIRNHGNRIPYSFGDWFTGWGNSDGDRETIASMVDSWERYKANPIVYIAAARATGRSN